MLEEEEMLCVNDKLQVLVEQKVCVEYSLPRSSETNETLVMPRRDLVCDWMPRALIGK